jgi:hypothetical protein
MWQPAAWYNLAGHELETRMSECYEVFEENEMPVMQQY